MRKYKPEPFVQNIREMEAEQRNREFERLIREGEYSVDIERMKQKKIQS